MTKLNLSKETLRALDAQESSAVAGGVFSRLCGPSVVISCIPPTETPTCWNCQAV